MKRSRFILKQSKPFYVALLLWLNLNNPRLELLLLQERIVAYPLRYLSRTEKFFPPTVKELFRSYLTILIREEIKTIYDRGSGAVVARVERLHAFIVHHQQEIILRYDGKMTLAGQRNSTVAELITKIGATNQLKRA